MPVVNLKGGRNLAFKIALYEGMKASRTASSLWTWLDKGNQGRDFDIIVLKDTDYFGQMLTEADRTSDEAVRGRAIALKALGGDQLTRPVVLWNPSYAFTYYGDVKGVAFNSSGDTIPESAKSRGGYYYQYKIGSATQQVRVIRVTESKMPAWIVLYHELGHVKQYFDGGGLMAWTGRLSDTNGIEAENLEKHENPICRDTGLSIRAHYKHSVYGFNDLKQRYSFGKKANGWKCSTTVPGRATIEQDLKREADGNAVSQPDSGIFHGLG